MSSNEQTPHIAVTLLVGKTLVHKRYPWTAKVVDNTKAAAAASEPTPELLLDIFNNGRYLTTQGLYLSEDKGKFTLDEWAIHRR